MGLTDRLDDETHRARRAAGEPEPRAAHAADALVAMLAGTGRPTRSSTELVVVCDLGAWQRGHAHGEECCHIVGAGPIPVHVARRLAPDAFVKGVLHDGVRIDTVAHFGCHIPAELGTALERGPPPHFDGVECVEADCGRRYGLEWDHVDHLAHGGATSYENLRARCWPHHRAKTERDRQAGLLGPSPEPRVSHGGARGPLTRRVPGATHGAIFEQPGRDGRDGPRARRRVSLGPADRP